MEGFALHNGGIGEPFVYVPLDLLVKVHTYLVASLLS